MLIEEDVEDDMSQWPRDVPMVVESDGDVPRERVLLDSGAAGHAQDAALLARLEVAEVLKLENELRAKVLEGQLRAAGSCSKSVVDGSDPVTPVGKPVRPEGIMADFRMNLTAGAADYTTSAWRPARSTTPSTRCSSRRLKSAFSA